MAPAQGKPAGPARLVGLVLHFAIMAVMAAFFVLAADRMPVLKARWVLAGIAYGIALWAVMNLDRAAAALRRSTAVQAR